MRLLKLILIAFVLGGICWVLSCSNPQAIYQTQNKEIKSSMILLWKDNPESLQILKDAHAKGIHLHVRMGVLPGNILGSTEISEDTATITIDVAKIDQAHDNIVPVLAHEIYHVRDAFLKMGAVAFMQQVDKDKDLPWSERVVEMAAIQAEDLLRAKLLREHPEHYKEMASTRAIANRRAAIFDPFLN